MAKAIDVLRYISETNPPCGEVQYQKLLYYVQGWSLAWDGTPMFEDRIEAWAMGPVVPSVRYRLGEKGDYDLSADQKTTIDAVVGHYRRWNGGELIEMTHAEPPWREARGDLPPKEKSNEEVTHNAMRREFTRQSLAGKGPKRPLSRIEEADEAKVLDLAARASRRWSRTLALLAE
ncbi:MAG: Panacea domain-containing protein [Propionibacteriaceae bacterium]|nr:Panacea domain-containing protein [Propionibacteriaceae bacterium]